MSDFILRRFPRLEEGEEEWDDHGNYAATVEHYVTGSMVEAIMFFYRETGEWPDQVALLEYDKGPKFPQRPREVKDLENELEKTSQLLQSYSENHIKIRDMASELFHTTKVAKLALCTHPVDRVRR